MGSRAWRLGMVMRSLAGAQLHTRSSLELWAVAARGALRSLGLIAPNGATLIRASVQI